MRPLALLVGLALAAAAALAAPPTLTPVLPATPVEQAPLWLFAVDDGQPRLAVSAERNGTLLAGRLDLPSRRLAPAWQAVAGRSAGGPHVADHWHLWAHGRHWLAYSVGPDARESHVMALDASFRTLFHRAVTRGENDRRVPTNDLFLVAEPEGVAVGHFLPGHGHRVFRRGKDGALRGTVDVGGGRYRHANGASAYSRAGGYLILAPETLNPGAESALLAIEVDERWAPTKARTLVDEPGMNLVMPSGAPLAGGWWVVHARARAARPPARGDDAGEIVRYLLSPEGKVASRTVLARRGNRPHTLLWGDRLVTTWDGGREGALLQVDRVTAGH